MDRILIVDDEPTIRRLLRVTLMTAGYEVIEAISGAEALTRAAADQPDAILLDYSMPDMDGIATAEALRATPLTSGIPILLMSAGIRLREHRGTQLVDGTLPKPFSIAAVTASLEALLEQSA